MLFIVNIDGSARKLFKLFEGRFENLIYFIKNIDPVVQVSRRDEDPRRLVS